MPFPVIFEETNLKGKNKAGLTSVVPGPEEPRTGQRTRWQHVLFEGPPQWEWRTRLRAMGVRLGSTFQKPPASPAQCGSVSRKLVRFQFPAPGSQAADPSLAGSIRYLSRRMKSLRSPLTVLSSSSSKFMFYLTEKSTLGDFHLQL